jgi:hypothetical protein
MVNLLEQRRRSKTPAKGRTGQKKSSSPLEKKLAPPNNSEGFPSIVTILIVAVALVMGYLFLAGEGQEQQYGKRKPYSTPPKPWTPTNKTCEEGARCSPSDIFDGCIKKKKYFVTDYDAILDLFQEEWDRTKNMINAAELASGGPRGQIEENTPLDIIIGRIREVLGKQIIVRVLFFFTLFYISFLCFSNFTNIIIKTCFLFTIYSFFYHL